MRAGVKAYRLGLTSEVQLAPRIKVFLLPFNKLGEGMHLTNGNWFCHERFPPATAHHIPCTCIASRYSVSLSLPSSNSSECLSILIRQPQDSLRKRLNNSPPIVPSNPSAGKPIALHRINSLKFFMFFERPRIFSVLRLLHPHRTTYPQRHPYGGHLAGTVSGRIPRCHPS